ncbi:LysR family transcriptional regulator [Mumia zhuanghuii]|uniref:LysR family transcriptional regulator n=1 Tax=Mumia zhuanghuii TaxID=2585211 RepID=A0A5C4MJR3_9ACTN|nr:LysR family transcriptional regulator [Mumia zhuanghuii]TNC34227.1 LysR family transcriptional regulator [Mumia zhuanghuii]TNC40328.1 LysR family transcriptional regulator [Mumia zhuanghuii]
MASIDPRRLAYLLAVYRTGGILAAADELHVTPSAVSQQIARLESEEGLDVLVRGPRGVTLTPAGRVLAEAAERIESELVEARKTLATMGEEVSGRVAVGAFQTSIQSIVGPAMGRVREEYPGIELVVAEQEPDDALRLLRAGELDLALVEQDEDSPAGAPRWMNDVVLLDEPWRVVIPTAFPTPTQVADLADAVWLGAGKHAAAARAVERLAESLGGSLRTVHEFISFEAAYALVAAGEGVAMVPALALQQDLPLGVEVVSLPGLGSRRVVARHRQTRREPGPAVSAVLDTLLATAAGVELT